MSNSTNDVAKTFDGIALEIARDGDLICTETQPLVAYQVAAAREVAIQLARIADCLEAIAQPEDPTDREIERLAAHLAQSPALFDQLLHEISVSMTARQIAELCDPAALDASEPTPEG